MKVAPWIGRTDFVNYTMKIYETRSLALQTVKDIYGLFMVSTLDDASSQSYTFKS